MNAESIREVLALVVQGNPCESVSFGATVTIVCGNPMSAARWRSRTPDGVLPVSGMPVQVVTVDMRGDTCDLHGDALMWERGGEDMPTIRGRWHCPTCDVRLMSALDDCAPVSRVQAIEAAEDHADQVAFDSWRERGL